MQGDLSGQRQGQPVLITRLEICLKRLMLFYSLSRHCIFFKDFGIIVMHDVFNKLYSLFLCDRVTGVLELLRRKSRNYYIISAKKWSRNIMNG